MAKKNRRCSTCGEKYSYCPNCDKNSPSWMVAFHAENCKNIFQICTQYNVGALAKKEAQDALSACDLSNKANFVSCVQRDLENIFAEDPKPAVKPAAKPKAHEVVLPEDK